MLRRGNDYRSRLADGRRVFYRGKLVEDVAKHPMLGAAAEHAAVMFDLQHEAGFQPSPVTSDPETQEPISAFYRRPETGEELSERSRLVEATTKRSGVNFNAVKVIGSDALFALTTVAAAVDSTRKTDYSAAVKGFLRKVAREDLAAVVAQTDVKGNRSLRPHEQQDPDLYVRIKERRKDGIVVRGAKVHITQAPVAAGVPW